MERSHLVCSICGIGVDPATSIAIGGVTVCLTCKHRYVQSLREGTAVTAPDSFEVVELTVKGRYVIAPRGVDFPPYCVKCGEPAVVSQDEALMCNGGFMVDLITSGAPLEGWHIRIGYCQCHWDRMQLGDRINTRGGVLGMVLFAGGLLSLGLLPSFALPLVPLGLFIGFFSVLLGNWLNRTVRASRIKNDQMWIKGTCKAFRNRLRQA